MDFTPDNLALIFQGARAKYDQGVAQAKTPLMDVLVETVTSSTREQIYGFLDRVPKLRKWLGERRVNNIVAQAYKLTNEKYEDTIGIKREDIEDDLIGLYSQRFARLGQQTKKWPEYLVRDKLQAGKAEVCFDGKMFFAADHYTSYGKKTGTQANLFTNKALSKANFITVKQAMAALKGADGEPLDDWGDDLVLVVDPSLEDTAKSILKTSLIVNTAGDGGMTNTQENAARLLVVNSLSSEPGVWYLADVSGEKPLLFQQRYAPDLVNRTNLDDPHVFEFDELLTGVRARGVAGLGLWWKMARVEPT